MEVEENKKRRQERARHRLYRNANVARKRTCFGEGSDFEEARISRVEDKWRKEIRGRELCKLKPEPKSNMVKLHAGLSKELSSLLMQMRTGKIGLRQFLFERRVPGIEYGRCECRQINQTVKHVLLNCRRYNKERRGFWTEQSRKAQEGGRSLDIERILIEAPSAKKASIFMNTGLTSRSRTLNTEAY